MTDAAIDSQNLLSDPQTTSPGIIDVGDYILDSEMNESTTSDPEHNLRPEHYASRRPLPNFAMERYRVSERTAAALASALLRDLEIIDDDGKNDVIDKSKVRRERDNLQKKLLKESRIVTNPKAFDGRKDMTLTHTKTPDGRLHPRRVLESHITVLRQPFSAFLGYVTAPEIASAPEIAETLLKYFEQKSINLSNLIGICCDGEPKNTGRFTGILRSLENQLGKPLHWFVC